MYKRQEKISVKKGKSRREKAKSRVWPQVILPYSVLLASSLENLKPCSLFWPRERKREEERSRIKSVAHTQAHIPSRLNRVHGFLSQGDEERKGHTFHRLWYARSIATAEQPLAARLLREQKEDGKKKNINLSSYRHRNIFKEYRAAALAF